MPITPAQASGSLTGVLTQTQTSSGKLTNSQAIFASELSQKTGLDPYVIASWLLAEESGAAAQARQRAGNNDWLNIGYTGSGTFGASDAIWSDPRSAADATAAWLAGQGSVPGYGKASSGIQNILHTAGQSVDAQIGAIQHSGWAASGYPGLRSLYDQVSGDKSTASQISNAVTAPLVAAGAGVSGTANALGSAASALGSIAGVFTWLAQPSSWLRILEILGATAAIYFGLKSLTGAPGITDTVRKVTP